MGTIYQTYIYLFLLLLQKQNININMNMNANAIALSLSILLYSTPLRYSYFVRPRNLNYVAESLVVFLFLPLV